MLNRLEKRFFLKQLGMLNRVTRTARMLNRATKNSLMSSVTRTVRNAEQAKKNS